MSEALPKQLCCTGDEGRAPRSLLAGAGFKPPRAAVVKSDGGERRGKGRTRSGQVRCKETSVSEPLKTCRKVQRWRQNRACFVSPG